jgi:hypothetical protein
MRENNYVRRLALLILMLVLPAKGLCFVFILSPICQTNFVKYMRILWELSRAFFYQLFILSRYSTDECRYRCAFNCHEKSEIDVMVDVALQGFRQVKKVHFS